MRNNLLAGIGAMLCLTLSSGCTSKSVEYDPYTFSTANKEAQPLTEKINDKFLADHGLSEDNVDFDNALRGKKQTLGANQKTVKTLNSDWTEDSNGTTVWSLVEYDTLLAANPSSVPATVNPSLWRNFKLNMEYGLYEVVAGHIYQVRGLDLSNITFVRTPGDDLGISDDGWLVLDPLVSKETAKKALDFINAYMKDVEELAVTLPVKGVIYSHSHIDHFGGVRGLFGSDTNPSGDADPSVVIFAPEGFTEHAVSENVIAGNAMGRRAIFMYGALTGVDVNGKSGVGSGLGLTNSIGEATLIVPTHLITETTPIAMPDNQFLVAKTDGSVAYEVDGTWEGLHMQFQLTPGTEAPAEMNTYFKDWDALWMAENSTNTMHNVLTLRGAEVRDPLIWAKYLTETIERWGNTAIVKFQSHHWPLWDSTAVQPSIKSLEHIVPYLEKQRDIYKFIHDQTVRQMNKGYIGEEISEQIMLPEELESNWATRGYYGTLRHNSRAVYQRYMGWYSGNPSDLNNLPPEKVAKKYVEFMGGPGAIIDKVITEINGADGDSNDEAYRWAAEVLKHVVFSQADNSADWNCNSTCTQYTMDNAKLLLADVYEQLGYMAESGPWRAEYLQGAFELRDFNPDEYDPLTTASADIIANMSLPMAFDFWAVQLNPVTFDGIGRDLTININVTGMPVGTDGDYTLTVKNSVLNYTPNQWVNLPANNSVTVSLTKERLNQLLTISDFDNATDITLDGDASVWPDFGSLLEAPDFWFPIVTPRPSL